MKRKKNEKAIVSGSLWETALRALKSIGSLEARAERSFGKYRKALQRWLVKIVVTGLSLFMSLAFLVLGLFFIAIDYGAIPRGVVFTCGGLLGLLVFGWMASSRE